MTANSHNVRYVTCYYGHTPHGDCLPVEIEVDARNVVRAIGGSGIVYCNDPLFGVLDECLLSDLPYPAFPFSNIFLTIEAAHLSAVAHYEAMRDEAECGLAELSRAKADRREAAL
jgi:hypothetical protein